MTAESDALWQFFANPDGPFEPEVQAVLDRMCERPDVSEHPIDRLLREAEEAVSCRE